MSTQPPAIEVQRLSKSYSSTGGDVLAIEDVSLLAGDGEFVSIVGPSGCGKSTLMMIVAGLRARSGGEVRLQGHDVRGPQTDLGIVFQTDVLLDWRSNLDNVLLQIELRKQSKQAHRERARQLLASVGLEGFEDRRPYELSGGMRQRVSICRALVHDPPVLLMDEPFGALDALTREQMMLDLQALWLERRKTVMFITHSIPEAVFLSDRVVVMTPRPGRVAKVLEIELPRPRTLDVEATPGFTGYVQEIRSVFEREGVIRDASLV